jgi:hypothetical protein
MLALVMFLFSIAAVAVVPMEKEGEELCGTWVNPEYYDAWDQKPAKLIINLDLSMFVYSKVTSIDYYVAKYTVENRWLDEEGNIWFKNIIQHPGPLPQFYYLFKISNSGTVLESVWDSNKWTIDLSPSAGTYEIHYRR